tara:strand:+ start:183 stop:668 length:486 start_codon:yes stop_codon:yes gene_type:complete
MIEFLIFCVVFILLLLGFLGAIFPIIPGPVLTFSGLLTLHFFTDYKLTEGQLLLYTLITIVVFLLDYLCQYFGVKKFGGKKNAIYGTIIGLFVGFFVPPVGFILGPFFGAFFGALIDNKNKANALKIAFGSFVGFALGTLIKLIYSTYVILWVVWKLLYLL